MKALKYKTLAKYKIYYFVTSQLNSDYINPTEEKEAWGDTPKKTSDLLRTSKFMDKTSQIAEETLVMMKPKKQTFKKN